MFENSTDDDNKGRIESLEERLNSRADPLKPRARRILENAAEDVPTDWGSDGTEQKINLGIYYEKHRSPVLKWLFLSAVGFFLASAAFATYVFMTGGHAVTGDNVGITIAGPISVGGGEELPLDIVVDNQNPTNLEVVSLAIDYPAGTRKPGDLSTDMSRYQEDLGSIVAGQSVKRHVSAVLFGEANSIQQIKVSVEYRVPGSSALFLKQKEYTVTVSSAPVSVVVETPPQIVSGQPFVISVTVNSNSPAVIKDLALQAEYGFGFTFVSADPSPVSRTDLWRIGDLKVGSKRVIKIRGKIDGQNDEQRAFRFSVGTYDTGNPRSLITTYLSTGVTVALQRPNISLSLAVNGDSGSTVYTAAAGSQIRSDVSWGNNSINAISNLQITATLSGAAFDRKSVATRGYYRSADNTIVWDKTTDNSFVSIAPGTDSTVDWSFAPFDLASLISAGLRNPHIDISLTASGVEQGKSGGSFDTTVQKTIKIDSKLSLASKVTYYDGPFSNTGPIPPRPDTETTYTITWTISNAVNDVSNAVVVGRLPPYMRYVGTVSPQGESVAYNPIGAIVTWNAGRVSAFSGFSQPAREVSFQVAFLPSVTQSGQAPTLMDQMSITGVDDFTNTTLSAMGQALTSDISVDSRAKQGDGTVGH